VAGGADAMSLLDEAIAAHGGVERFDAATAVRVRQRAGGLAFVLKGRRNRPAVIDGVVSTRELRTELRDYPRPGLRGLVEPDGAVRIEDADGRLLAERREPRPAFRDLRHQVRWDDLDQLYFIGATALPNYALTPFWLRWPGVETEELPGRRLRATFPEGMPVHSREQTYWFGPDGRLTRLDYTAEVIGSWANAAHRVSEYRTFDGIAVPTRRRVVPRGPGDRPLPGPTLVWIEVDDFSLALLPGGADPGAQ
jgi:hypothetical protein